MNILIAYSSETGNTKKLANGIYNELCAKGLKVEIMPIKEVCTLDTYDSILVGYWVDKGGPNKEAAKFMETIKENNEVIGRYICQVAVSKALIEGFKKLDSSNYHAISDEKIRRYKIAELHSNESEILSAAIMFSERLTIV